MTAYDYTEIWNKFTAAYRNILNSELFYSSYILRSKLLFIKKGAITMYCENTFVQRFYTERYDSVSSVFAEILGEEFNLVFTTEMLDEPSEEEEPFAFTEQDSALSGSSAASTLNPRLTFDNFVVGNNNRQAFSVAQQVAFNPGTMFNPVFIYGNSGLGKTHLLHAVGNEILKKDPTKKVLYVTTETFTTDFITSIQYNRTEAFRNKYRSVDVLLIDDIQFISNKEGTQEEFFNTFNELHSKDKQIMISCDRKISEIKDLADRLKTRFENGVITDIQIPDYEVRVAIMLNKTKSLNMDIPDEIIDSIAQSDINNVREIEGILNQFLLMTTHGQEITMETASLALKHLNITEVKEVNTELIINVVSRFFNVNVSEIKSKTRTKKIVIARHIAMYFCREKLGYSYSRIAREFGGMDHTSVSDGCKKAQQLYLTDNDVKYYIDEIKRMIG